MTEKEIKARYKFAVLGFLWIVLNPLLQMIVMGFIFQFFVPVKVHNYFLFLFTGLLPWNFFSMTVSRNTTTFINERNLIQKAHFPREILITSIALANFFHLLIAVLLLFAVLVGDKLINESYSFSQLLNYMLKISLVLPIFVCLLIFSIGVSLLLASLNVKYRDVNFFVQAVLPLLFYATPIVYTLNLLPSNMSNLMYLNPMTSMTELFHYFLLNQPIYNANFIYLGTTISIFICLLSWLVYKKESPFFDDWI